MGKESKRQRHARLIRGVSLEGSEHEGSVYAPVKTDDDLILYLHDSQPSAKKSLHTLQAKRRSDRVILLGLLIFLLLFCGFFSFLIFH